MTFLRYCIKQIVETEADIYYTQKKETKRKKKPDRMKDNNNRITKQMNANNGAEWFY